MRRSQCVMIAATLLISSFAGVTTQRATVLAAQASCTPGSRTSGNDFHAGWQEMPHDHAMLEGATVTANTYNPYSNSGDGNSVWSMLVNSTTHLGFTQVGYDYLNGTPNFFVEWQFANGLTPNPIWVYPSGSGITAPSAGTTYTYNTLYNPSTDDYSFTIGVTVNGVYSTYPAVASQNNQYGYGFSAGQEVIWSSLGPSGLLFDPYGVEIFGETHNAQDQMFGDTFNPEDLSLSKYYDSRLGSWEAMGSNYGAQLPQLLQNETYFAYQPIGSSSTDLNIWDVGCPNSLNVSNQYMDANQVLDAAGTGGDQDLQSSSGTNGPYHLQSQTDGNLIVYDVHGNVLWEPTTTSHPDYLTLQTDGNVVLYNAWGNTALFNTGTSGDGDAGALVMQGNGDVVLYGQPNNVDPLWDTGSEWDSMNAGLIYGGQLSTGNCLGSFPTTGDSLCMQSDGNLVLYQGSTALWWSNTAGTGSNNRINMQPDGNLVMYTGGGTKVWSTNTSNGDSQDHFVVYDNGSISSLRVETNTNAVVWSWTS